MSDLVAFLRECLDADERAAQAAQRDSGHPEWGSSDLSDSIFTADTGSPVVSGPYDYLADGLKAHIVLFDPQRMLDEVEAKRRIVDLHSGPHECSTYDYSGEIDTCTWVTDPVDCSTLLLLALPYRDRPGYDPAWGER